VLLEENVSLTGNRFAEFANLILRPLWKYWRGLHPPASPQAARREGETYRLDPIEDLRPVCPNCHAMLRQQKPALKIEELKAIILTRQGPQ
jgi:hypothetical protein